MEFCGSNFSEVYQRICRTLLEDGVESNPRALPIRELLGVTLRLSNPRTRMLDVPKKSCPHPSPLESSCGRSKRGKI